MRWSMLPVSVVTHVAAVVALLIAPIFADVRLPTPWPLSGVKDYIAASAAPPPPPVHQSAPQRVQHRAVPLTAPDAIRPEPEIVTTSPGVEFGLTSSGPVADAGVGSGFGVAVPAPPPPPPPAVQRPTTVRPGGQIREPKPVVRVPPVYPEIARSARIEGMVIVEATIDEKGVVVDARVLRSVPLLDGAALDALKQWRYTPTLLNGVPVRVLMTITFNFRLGDRLP